MSTHGQCFLYFSPFDQQVSDGHRFCLAPELEINHELHLDDHGVETTRGWLTEV